MMDEKHKKLAREALKKYDKEANTADHTGFLAHFVAALAITFSVFQLYTAVFGVLDAQLQRAAHLGFGLALVFLLYPTRGRRLGELKTRPEDYLLAFLGAATPGTRRMTTA